MTARARLHCNLRAEHGMSLLELLVAMLMSIVILGALVGLLEVTVNQEQRITDRTQADQIGRTVMTNIVDKLHSSCAGFGSAPIQVPKGGVTAPLTTSGHTSLWFISVYGENDTSGNESSAAPLPELITEHDIAWEKEGTISPGKEFGTLVDYAFTGKGEPPNWVFPTLSAAHATKTVLAKDVIPSQVGGKPSLFQYYTYKAGELAELGSSEVEPLSEVNAENVAKVSITFTQASNPTKTAAEAEPNPDTRPGRTALFSDSVVMRFSPTESTTEESKPCE
jgi:hypothetical protein